MNFLVRFYPGDDAVRLAVSGALQIAGIVVLAIVASWTVARRNAGLRDGIWRAALALACIAPLLSWGFDRAGINIWQTSVRDAERRPLKQENQEAPARIAVSFVDPDDGAAKLKSRLTANAAPTRDAKADAPRWSDAEEAGNRQKAETIIGTLTVIWAIGVALLLVRLLVGIWLVARLRREMKPFVELPSAVTRRLLKTLGVSRLPPIMVCQRIGGPASVGIWRPVLVLPADLASRANDDVLHDMLAHECAHALRRDALIAFVQQVVVAVYWVHPLVYVLNRQLARAREEICDNAVLAGTTPTKYARTLLALSEAVPSTGGRLAVIPMFDRRWRLARRVAEILDSRRIVMTRLNRPATATIGIMTITSGLALAAICAAAEPPKQSQTKPAAAIRDPDLPTATTPNDGGKTPTKTEPKAASVTDALSGQPTGPGELLAVPVSRVVERKVSEFVDFSGNIVAPESVKIISRVTGYLTRTTFKEGADVKKGDKLFEIDPRPFQAEVDQAEAELRVAETRLKLAKAEFERFTQLLKSSAVSQEDYTKTQATVQEAEAAMSASRANLESRKLTLSFCTITSPIDGQAGGYNVTPGNLVKQDETVLTTIVSHDSIGASFNLDERTWLKLAKMPRDAGAKPLSAGGEMRLFVRADDETGSDQEGVLSYIGNEFDRTTGTIAARGAIANPPLKGGARLFIPGMHVTIRLIVGPPHKALLVADGAIFTTADGPMVWVVNNKDCAEERAIMRGQLQDDGLRVIGSLQPDERVVVSPVGVSPGRIRPKLVPMAAADRDKSKSHN